MNTGDATTIISSVLTDISTVLTSGLTSVLSVLAVLIGLFFVIRFTLGRISRGK